MLIGSARIGGITSDGSHHEKKLVDQVRNYEAADFAVRGAEIKSRTTSAERRYPPLLSTLQNRPPRDR